MDKIIALVSGLDSFCYLGQYIDKYKIEVLIFNYGQSSSPAVFPCSHSRFHNVSYLSRNMTKFDRLNPPQKPDTHSVGSCPSTSPTSPATRFPPANPSRADILFPTPSPSPGGTWDSGRETYLFLASWYPLW